MIVSVYVFDLHVEFDELHVGQGLVACDDIIMCGGIKANDHGEVKFPFFGVGLERDEGCGFFIVITEDGDAFLRGCIGEELRDLRRREFGVGVFILSKECGGCFAGFGELIELIGRGFEGLIRDFEDELPAHLLECFFRAMELHGDCTAGSDGVFEQRCELFQGDQQSRVLLIKRLQAGDRSHELIGGECEGSGFTQGLFARGFETGFDLIKCDGGVTWKARGGFYGLNRLTGGSGCIARGCVGCFF